MTFDIYESGKKIKQLSLFDFISFYYDEFGTDCGNPSSIADGLEINQATYIGKGYLVLKNQIKESFEPPSLGYCAHSKKYLNVISNSLQFYVCPDCKEEIK